MGEDERTFTRCTRLGCGQMVTHVLTLGHRRWAINPEPSPDGHVVLITTPDGRTRARILTGTELPAQQTAYTEHDRTCPGLASRNGKPRGLRCSVCRMPMPVDPGRAERWITHPCCDPEFGRAMAWYRARTGTTPAVRLNTVTPEGKPA